MSAETTTPVTIRLAQNAPSERDAAETLRRVLHTYDLDRWCWTRLVTIDRTQIGAHSHPLTIGSHDFGSDEEAMLRVFVHEQLHWFVNTRVGTRTAIRECAERWPNPPEWEQPRWGGHLHFPVNALEVGGLIDLLGEARGRAVISRNRSYTWIYQTVLDEWPWFERFLDRHGLVLPDAPPPYETGGAVLQLGTDRPTLTLVTGHPSERLVADALAALYREYDLTRWQWTSVVRVDADSRPMAKPTLTLGATAAANQSSLLCLWLQVQLPWWLDATDETVRSRALEALSPPGRRLPGATLVVCNALAIMKGLLTPAEIDEAIAGSLNRRLFEAALRYWPVMEAVLEQHGLLVETWR